MFSVLVASVSLAGCGGGGGSGASLLASDITVCGLSCDNSSGGSSGGSGGSGGSSGGSGGGGGGVDTSGGSPGADNGNGGNTTNLNTGDPVIALEAGTVVSSKTSPSLGKLTVLSGSPNTAKLEVDTNTANNNKWAVPKTMGEYLYGTNASFGLGLGAAGGSGTVGGVSYNEYRAYQNSNTEAYDELLQVWTFGDSYAAQYRDETSGKETADKQAWAFGGMNAGATPGTRASGTATYNGRFGSTAITRNWINSEDGNQEVDWNNSWRVNGTSQATVNFNTNAVSAELSPEVWQTEADLNNHSGYVVTVNTSVPADPNYAGYMSSKIMLNGTLTKTATGNSIAGGATMDSADGWLSDGTNNPFYGGIYGANGQDITGVFATTAVNPSPIGGTTPLNNPGRGYINHSGAFNGECTVSCPTITP
ncbi:MAG: hypothetical protein JNM45_04125 [Rhizobiales bacterium]|nr:hypothetical protein [Hyphomicrobiales bacterium]